jgi:carbon monoxide dehydrogenase subunit G
MEFENSFEVPLPPERAWPLLLDVARIVPCMPGAELTETVDRSTFKGKVTVRLGPVTLNFAGTLRFTDIDSANYRARADARGNDSKGRGNATATVQFHLAPSPAGSSVAVHTNLALTGSVAQYGRATGIVRELASQITTEFAQRLSRQISREGAPSDKPAPRVSQAEAAPKAVSESLSAGRLIWRAFVAFLRDLLGRKPK